jgi:hypothetical protein
VQEPVHCQGHPAYDPYQVCPATGVDPVHLARCLDAALMPLGDEGEEGEDPAAIALRAAGKVVGKVRRWTGLGQLLAGDVAQQSMVCYGLSSNGVCPASVDALAGKVVMRVQLPPSSPHSTAQHSTAQFTHTLRPTAAACLLLVPFTSGSRTVACTQGGELPQLAVCFHQFNYPP